MFTRISLVILGLAGIIAADDANPIYVDLTDQQALVLIKPGETKEVTLCWRNVPGGRAPDMALSDKAELSGAERKGLRTVGNYERNGVAFTLDWKRSGEISTQLIGEGRIFWVVAAVKIAAAPKTTAGPLTAYVHYAAGTGRGVYRRGAICVLVGPD